MLATPRSPAPPTATRHPTRILALLGVLGSAAAFAATETWPLTVASDYRYDVAAVTFSGGVAHLYSAVKGTGADGDLVVTGSTFDLASDASGSRTVADGVSWVLSGSAAAGGDTLTLSSAATGLETGDELLVLDIGGTSTSPATGVWETVRVEEVAGSVVTLASTLAATYDGVGHAVLVQRIPNYQSVTLTSATLTTAAWDGSTGGVVAFRVQGTLSVDVDSEINVDYLGYRGGAGGSTAGGATEGGESVGGMDGPGGAVLTNGTLGGGGGEGPSSIVGTYGGSGGYGAGGGGSDGTRNSDDGAGGGGGGGHAGGGGGGGGGNGCGASVGGAGGAGGAAGVAGGGGGLSTCPGGNGGAAGSAGAASTGHCYDSAKLAGNVGSGVTGGDEEIGRAHV